MNKIDLKKVDLLKLAKIGSLGITLVSGVLATWISSKENQKTLEKLVEERLKK